MPPTLEPLELSSRSSASNVARCDDSAVAWYRLSRVKKFQICLWAVAFFALVSMEKDIFLLSSESPEGKDIKYKNQTQTTKITAPMTTLSPTVLPTLRPTARPVTLAPTATRSSSAITGSSSSSNNLNQPTITFPPQPPISPSAFTVRLPPSTGQALEELPAAAQSFVAQHCDLKNVPYWVPGGEKEEAWKLRTPYLILAGVWNGGVGPLSQALQLHPQIRKRVGVQDFFLPRQFYKYQASTGVKVFSARQRMYAQVYSKITTPTFKENTTATVAMDVSPGYLFYASQTSVSIQCVSPWAKTIILLRDPVERVYHQWVFGRDKLGLRLSLEEWMAQELKAMQLAGLISSNNASNSQRLRRILLENMDSEELQQSADPQQQQHRILIQNKEEEREAWKHYQSQRNLAGAIGRSMYVLQLEEWFETMVAAGKVPKEEVFLMRSEVWEAQPYQEYQQLISFLGLAPYTPPVLNPQKAYENSRHTPMKEETRQLLQDFFAPYNQRLAALLKQYGFNDGDWSEPLWKNDGSS
jgi:hypothetical protein